MIFFAFAFLSDFINTGCLDCVACAHETLGDFAHFLALLHGDDTHVILLVQPDEQVLLVVVEDPG